MPGYESKPLSSLMEWTLASGALWFHMLISNGFNYPDSIPFSQLINHFGANKFEQVKKEFGRKEKTKSLADKKEKQLKEYDEARDQVTVLETRKAAGQITEAEFVAAVAKLC